MIPFTVATIAAAAAPSPALHRIDEPPADVCNYRIYYLPFPPGENGAAPTAPIINGEREKDDSFVVTVRRKLCRGRLVPGVGASKRWIDDPAQPVVTWSATVAPTSSDQPKPPSSFLKGPTIKMGPDGETLLAQPRPPGGDRRKSLAPAASAGTPGTPAR